MIRAALQPLSTLDYLVDELKAEATRFVSLGEDIAPGAKNDAAFSQLAVAALLNRLSKVLASGHIAEIANVEQLNDMLYGVKEAMEADLRSIIDGQVFEAAKSAAERAFNLAGKRLEQGRQGLWN